MQRSHFGLLLFVTGFVLSLPASGRSQEIWFAPAPGQVAQLFAKPEEWPQAARRTAVLSLGFNEILKTPPETLNKLLSFLAAHGIKLNVEMLAMPVDKKVCGDGLEGTVWPGEPVAHAEKLKELHLSPAYFSYDGPLTVAHLYHGNQACNLSITEAAQHLAIAEKALRERFPGAKFVDIEPPTYIRPAEWDQVLRQWLRAYESATGTPLYGMTMDVNWQGSWQDSVRDTVRVLRESRVRVGMFLNSTAGGQISPAQWIAQAKSHGCAMRGLGPFDHVMVANFSARAVQNIPESDPSTLTSLLNWYASGARC
jgi:hypothetical protein